VINNKLRKGTSPTKTTHLGELLGKLVLVVVDILRVHDRPLEQSPEEVDHDFAVHGHHEVDEFLLCKARAVVERVQSLESSLSTVNTTGREMVSTGRNRTFCTGTLGVARQLHMTGRQPTAFKAFGIAHGTTELRTLSALTAHALTSSFCSIPLLRHSLMSCVILLSHPSPSHRTSGPAWRLGKASARIAAGVKISTHALLNAPSRRATTASSPLKISSERVSRI
jgi:hypothetical protein